MTNELGIINSLLCSERKKLDLWEEVLIWGVGWDVVKEAPCVKYLSFLNFTVESYSHAEPCEAHLKVHKDLCVCIPSGPAPWGAPSHLFHISTPPPTHTDSYPYGLHFSVLNFI